MILQTFLLLASLARLKSQRDTLRHACLSSEPPRASLPLTGWLYLWTWTLPTETATLPNLATAWAAFMKHRAVSLPSFRGVRVFEPSATERWHVHGLTLDRYEIEVVREYSQRCGFGRVNVRRIPAAKAAYVCKYILKSHWYCGTEGRRMFACFGFKGIKREDVFFRDTWHEYVVAHSSVPAGMFLPWQQRETMALRFWLSSTSQKNQQQQQPLSRKQHDKIRETGTR